MSTPLLALTLRDLKPGESGRVRLLSGEGNTFQRLCEMGFVPGAAVRVVRYAPFGDPLHVELDAYHLSLRRAEAALVEVERD